MAQSEEEKARNDIYADLDNHTTMTSDFKSRLAILMASLGYRKTSKESES